MSTTLMLAVLAAPLLADPGKCDVEASVCLRQMAEALSERGWVGIDMEHEKEGGPVKLTAVVPGSPAAAAGLQPGDVLLAVNGVTYEPGNEERLRQVYKSFSPGEIATFSVEREGERHGIEVRLVPLPEAMRAQWIGKHMLHAHVEEPSEQVAAKPEE